MRVARIAWFCVVAVVVIGALGCQGERPGAIFDETTPDGRWRIDGTLIRSYNVTLMQAYDSIHALAAGKNWLIRKSETSTHTSHISIKTRELVEIEFSVWAPANSATDIGIEYAGGDKIGAIRVFDELERILPGKRITVNQP